MPAPKRPPLKRRLTTVLVDRIKRRDYPFQVWDTKQPGLALRVETTGFKSFKFVYSLRGRVRWYSIGPADRVDLGTARRVAADLGKRVTVDGEDPQAARRAARTDGTFGQLADKYLDHAKKKNRSWPQARALVERHLLSRWSKLQAADIRRGDVRALTASIGAPVVANQTLAAASAIFTWAIREELLRDNPCRLVERNPTRSRERVLSDGELPLFWRALDDADPIAAAALRVLLLTGQRPGEVAQMRREHLSGDGWWTMPGAPEAATEWPGTKNGQTHRVWLPRRAREIVTWLSDENETTGFVFAGPRGRPTADLDGTMRSVCARLGIERATPHDLRRTFSTRMMELGFGRDCLNRVTNHREGGIASVYDRHAYAEENKRAIETTAARLLALCGEGEASNVVAIR